jgi:hypothetical protein
MTQRSLALAVVLVAGLTAWAAVRPHPVRAGTGDPAAAREIVAADYGANDEDTAARRWATGQARHWRHLMVKR